VPYSSNNGKHFTDYAVKRLAPHIYTKTVLDLGVGCGTYSDRYSKTLLPTSDWNWTGVEIWHPYFEQFKLVSKYHQIFRADVREFFKDPTHAAAGRKYGITFIGDLLEHLTKDEAVELVRKALEVSEVVVISIPIVHYPQGEFEGNPHEAHIKDDWSNQEVLDSFEHIFYHANEEDIGVYLLSRRGTKQLPIMRMIMDPKIAFYSICKNEGPFVNRMLESVEGIASEVVICDTGSTDGTYEWLVSEHRTNIHRQHVKPYKIAVSPWRFDDARNTALGLVDPNIDICVSIDADELVEDQFGWEKAINEAVKQDWATIGRISDRYHHRFKTIWDWQDEGKSVTEHWHERIHTRHNYRWKLPVHEVLVKSGAEHPTFLSDIKMVQKPDLSKSRGSYLPLLMVATQEDPDRWRLWSFMAGEQSQLGMFNEALSSIHAAKLCKDADIGHLCIQAARIYEHLGDFNNAEHGYIDATRKKKIREYHVYLAQFYIAREDWVSAQLSITRAAKFQHRSTGYEFDASCWDQGFEDIKARISSWQR
jgi:hypothetical protein